jgi:hypothetical protein
MIPASSRRRPHARLEVEFDLRNIHLTDLHLYVLHYAHRLLPLSTDPALEPLAISSERTRSPTVHRLSSRMKIIFGMANRCQFGAKISRKMPALPHTAGKKGDPAQIFVPKTTP